MISQSLLKDKRINNKPTFYKTFFESGIRHVTDLRFDLNLTVRSEICSMCDTYVSTNAVKME